jgi:hypothetical protein
MSGIVSFFVSTLVDVDVSSEVTKIIRSLARSCPDLIFHDRQGGHIVRIRGGDEPVFEEPLAADREEIERALDRFGANSRGDLEFVPTSWIVPINGEGHVFVPGPVPLDEEGSSPTLGIDEWSVATLDALKELLEEIIATVDEVRDSDLAELAFEKRVLDYAAAAQALKLVLVIRYV